MNNIFTFLEKKAHPREPFETLEEFKFFLENRNILTKIPKFSFLYDSEYNDFDIMRANIIIQGYINKSVIEKEAESLALYYQNDSSLDKRLFNKTLKEKLVDLPYFIYEGNKLFIPFFSKTLNDIYNNEPEKLLEVPYIDLKNYFTDSIIDPFDNFGAELYDSLFTRLIKVGEYGKYRAYLHYDMNIIYIVNPQGRLDEKIYLFDKYIKNPNYNHMLERTKPVVDAYFNNSRSAFIEALFNNGFLSSHLLLVLRRSSF